VLFFLGKIVNLSPVASQIPFSKRSNIHCLSIVTFPFVGGLPDLVLAGLPLHLPIAECNKLIEKFEIVLVSPD